MFIDIHAHAYRNCPPFVAKFCTAEQVIERYDQAGIEKGVLLPIVSPEIYLPQANEDELTYIPGILIISQNPKGKPEHLFLFQLEQLLERSDIPFTGFLNYLVYIHLHI